MSITLERPAESAGELYFKTPASPEEGFQAIGRLRKEARDEIERLIEWLDSTIDCDQDAAVDDGTCDDDADSEPSLGSFDRMSDQIKAWHHRGWGDVDIELDRADSEPSLGSIEDQNQKHWTGGTTDDREGDPGCDDFEPNVDDESSEDAEPAFGWSDEEGAHGRYPSLMGWRVDQ